MQEWAAPPQRFRPHNPPFCPGELPQSPVSVWPRPCSESVQSLPTLGTCTLSLQTLGTTQSMSVPAPQQSFPRGPQPPPLRWGLLRTPLRQGAPLGPNPGTGGREEPGCDTGTLPVVSGVLAPEASPSALRTPWATPGRACPRRDGFRRADKTVPEWGTGVARHHTQHPRPGRLTPPGSAGAHRHPDETPVVR